MSFEEEQPARSTDAEIERFEADWRRGEPPDLNLWSESPRELLLQLVAIDIEYRWRRAAPVNDALGQPPTMAQYARLLPALGHVDELPLWLLAEEYRARHRWGDRPTYDRFLAAYPKRMLPLLVELQLITKQFAADDINTQPPRYSPRSLAPDPRAPLDSRDYLIERHLGSGGMGRVYRALQRSLGKRVAIKALRKSKQHDPHAVAMLLAEARTLARLRHPNIVGVHGLGRFPGGGYFLVMDWVDGDDLATRIRERTLPIDEALRISGQVAAAIQHAHDNGVIHCDIKPANVLLDKTGHVFVADFGLARLLDAGSVEDAGSVGGTRGFMAPEILSGEHIQPTASIDVYGLGALLAALLSERTPTEATNEATRDAIAGIAAVVGFCLRSDPSERPLSAREVAGFVEGIRRALKE